MHAPASAKPFTCRPASSRIISRSWPVFPSISSSRTSSAPAPFKERGALNKLLTLSESERKRGVIAASAGNHAQGVAFHAAARGIRAQIVMPLATTLVKVAATRSYGAEVILHGESYDESL